MLYLLSAFLLPPLLVFGLYHLLTWINLFRINERVYWRRVAIASAAAHIVLATGFFIFTYVDYTAGRLEAAGLSFSAFLFNRSEFWRLTTILDTATVLVILALFSLLDRMAVNPPQLLVLTIALVYIVGTLQWYWLGGAVGALLERFWEGLKTGDEEDQDWM
jgi:hypothetical protein